MDIPANRIKVSTSGKVGMYIPLLVSYWRIISIIYTVT